MKGWVYVTVDKDEIKILQKAIILLEKTKSKLLDLFEKQGFDAAYFDVDVDLMFSVNDKTVRVRESWRKLPYE